MRNQREILVVRTQMLFRKYERWSNLILFEFDAFFFFLFKCTFALVRDRVERVLLFDFSMFVFSRFVQPLFFDEVTFSFLSSAR